MFHEGEEVTNEDNGWLRAQAAEFCDIGIQNLVPRQNRCLDKDGSYVEKQLKLCFKIFFTRFFLINIFKNSIAFVCIDFLDVLRIKKHKHSQLHTLFCFTSEWKNILLIKYKNFSRYRELLTEIQKPSQFQKHTRLKIYNTLALPALLQEWGTWANREEDHYGITSAEMKFMRITAKYTWQDYETNEDILSELKINPVLKKIRSYRNKWIQHVRCMDRD